MNRESIRQKIKALSDASDSVLDKYLLWKAGLHAPFTLGLTLLEIVMCVALGAWLRG